ncbi:MarR family winged helix-turn-helix transcriptional regulator [Pseudonocardia aurantiaca]|uniref:MarR family winged helix-turn-helix transcriptional regulator n=1 Tax=Pseudonocardia aurantiaca TaxID=75290 RepID=A0ABW4FU07_9PSEU
MTAEAGGPDSEALLDSIGATLGKLRRRTHLVKVVDPPVERKDLSRNLVINIVDEANSEITVGGVADQLGIDPSAASRMVSDLISQGLLERLASQRDGRRTVLRLTPEGTAARDRFRRQHRQAFEHITRDWPARERLEFARLLRKYVDSADDL